MKLIVQAPNRPERIVNAITDMIGNETCELRIGVAYITTSGTNLLLDRIIQRLGQDRWSSIRKRIVTCFDYGLTDPSALRLWLSVPRCFVRVHNSSLLAGGGLVPKVAFHTKYYEFRAKALSNIMVGSANLSEKALVYNSEAATTQVGISNLARLDSVWSRVISGSTVLQLRDVDTYEEIRSTNPPPIEQELNAQFLSPAETLWAAVESGRLNLLHFEYLWVDAGGLSGGSGNQLELPRGANRFFNFNFDDYAAPQARIGTVDLRIKDILYIERPLSWHGDNGMERVNLPTGRSYSNLVMLFRRRGGYFDLDWTTNDSQRAIAWSHASAAISQMYKLGQRSPRTCGLF